METLRLIAPPLSFKPNELFLTKRDDLKYIISADGFDIGWLITFGMCEIVLNGKQNLTQQDKEYLIWEFLGAA